MKYDLLVRGGTLVDPGQGISAPRDVAFHAGRVAAVMPTLSPGDAAEVIDATGGIVAPGLIDIHTHVYHGVFHAAAHADRAALASGVTTVVDAGSSGWSTFPGFRDYVLPTYRTRVFAFLHIGAAGLTLVPMAPELQDIRLAQVDEAVRAVRENPDLICGVKVRITHAATGQDNRDNAREALRRARQAADLAGTRLMVHVSGSPLALPEILDQLRPGDIVTHIFNGYAERALGPDGRVQPEVRAAAARGVVMDVGHASIHCDVTVARQAMADGLLPTTLSTDLHAPPPGRVLYGLRGLMSKFLALGMSLEDVIGAVTNRAAAAIGKSAELGSLAPGMAGDAVVLDLEEGDFTFLDHARNEVRARRRFRTRCVVRDGQRLRLTPAARDEL
ncbi:MAG: amidohydrolase/deacetylase family metallohydrolase [Candidatus Rokubacteria bacterium]|nr:amidohydrolase/deacetylase family metallohydrolase [Candidatus Rokubacteria bacterium]